MDTLSNGLVTAGFLLDVHTHKPLVWQYAPVYPWRQTQ